MSKLIFCLYAVPCPAHRQRAGKRYGHDLHNLSHYGSLDFDGGRGRCGIVRDHTNVIARLICVICGQTHNGSRHNSVLREHAGRPWTKATYQDAVEGEPCVTKTPAIAGSIECSPS